jgi:hypothetical protein
MNSRQLHHRARPIWAAVILACASALVFGFSSAPASARTQGKAQIVILNMKPAQPKAGQNFSGTFKLMKGDVVINMTKVACMAQIGGRPANLITQETDGIVGRCAWSIPSSAKGKTFDGILAVQGVDGIWYYAGFDLPIR